jgi:alkylation response protein AidB-like acyl-CoA dehydrogenase
MTFELSADQQSARDRARAIARARIAPLAGAIDDGGSVPADLMQELAAARVPAPDGDAVTLVVVVEELAIASGAVAARAALSTLMMGESPGGILSSGISSEVRAGSSSGEAQHAGLCGACLPAADHLKGRLVLAAVALGLGRAAMDAALAELKSAHRASKESDKPHWVVADAATELEAARLLALQAAQILDAGGDAAGAVAMAKLMAAAAAERAIDAALRLVGPDGYVRGSLLERLARDVRAAGLLMGTEEDQRTTAASQLLPG